MRAMGPKNSITDVMGVLVGHFTKPEAASGVSVVVCPKGGVGGVDVRGAAPGTRETDLLAPQNLVERVQAVALCGGSVFGLAAADGVVKWLAERNLGFPLGKGQAAPIVPAAVIYDLGRGKTFRPPVNAKWGYLACESASAGPVPMGCVGVGTGAVAGGIKAGVGTASEVLGSGLVVGALVVVNAYGSVLDPKTGLFWEGRLELEGELGETSKHSVELPGQVSSGPGRNTTLAVVATDAALSKAQALKIAQMAHDGLARAIRPSHTMFDGDTVFCLATCEKDLPRSEGFFEGGAWASALNELGRAAGDTVSRAIMRGMAAAAGAYGYPALRDLPERSESPSHAT